ncbi:MAG: septation protein A [Woeseiaceae bacterium]|nr:septation protein A [Woeseiaceae bacterium]NIP20927.1 septation protein A [Woeseiaceae bacterium]NIS89694.1 septation protein A [Woeseiaceae bacterium]
MHLLVDYLPIIFFFGSYIATKDIFLAIVVIMVVAPIVLAGQWYFTRKLNKMTAVSTGLVVAFGAITLALDNPVFFYWKPTVFYWVFALVCLGSHFVGEKTIVQRMLQAASQGTESPIELPSDRWRTLNLMWVIYSVVAGALNIYVAYTFSEPTWVKFKLFGLLGLTLVFLVVQSLWIASVIEQNPGTDADSEA